MDEESKTAENDLNTDANKGTTGTDSTATDQQTGRDANNLDESSKSTDTDSADGDKKPPAGAEDTPAPLDADIDDWAEKKGFPKATSDEQKRAYQGMRDDQREFTRTRQAGKDSGLLLGLITKTKDGLKSTDGDDELDPMEKRMAAVEADRIAERTTRLQSEFYTAEKVTPEEHKVILDIFKEKVDRQPNDKAKLAAVDLWGAPEALPDLLDIARARLAKSTDTSSVADKAAQDERARIARESNAKSPGRNATVTTTSDKTDAEAQTERFRARFNKK